MLWVYDHYKYFHSYSAGIDISRQNLTSTSGVFRNKLGGVLRFPRNHSTAGTYRGHASAKIRKNKHQIVRFRGIFAVKRRYEILAEMSVLT